MPVILCHKCAGVLASSAPDKQHGLNGCQCISGWIRGFEKQMTVEQAAQKQIEQEEQWRELFTRQGRPSFFSPTRMQRAQRVLLSIQSAH